MTCICIGPVCIPIQAFIPFFYFFWQPLYRWLQKTFPGTFKPTAKKGKKVKCDGDVCTLVDDDGEEEETSTSTTKKSNEDNNMPREKRDKKSKPDASTESNVTKRTNAVVVMEDDEEWENLSKQAEEKGVPIVVCFTASWCVPCQAIAPKVIVVLWLLFYPSVPFHSFLDGKMHFEKSFFVFLFILCYY